MMKFFKILFAPEAIKNVIEANPLPQPMRNRCLAKSKKLSWRKFGYDSWKNEQFE